MNGDAEKSATTLPRRGVSRRLFLMETAALTAGAAAAPAVRAAGAPSAAPARAVQAGAAVPGAAFAAAPPGPKADVRMLVNGETHELSVDPRVTLLDALRDHLRLTGTKKGCDRGQCGACTVIVNGRRVNSCLSLALSHDGDEIRTVEGLGSPGNLHPLQRAFIEHDAFQCGYCTPGQICSGVALLDEARAGAASAATPDVRQPAVQLSDDEIRERMSGNICRCGAYVNIVAAIRDYTGGDHTASGKVRNG